MITQQDIKAAKDAFLKKQADYDNKKDIFDELAAYTSQIAEGTWAEEETAPIDGPLSTKAASYIGVTIDKDYGYPFVFVREDVQNSAIAYHTDLKEDLEKLEGELLDLEQQQEDLIDELTAQTAAGEGEQQSAAERNREKRVKSEEDRRANKQAIVTIAVAIGLVLIVIFGSRFIKV